MSKPPVEDAAVAVNTAQLSIQTGELSAASGQAWSLVVEEVKSVSVGITHGKLP